MTYLKDVLENARRGFDLTELHDSANDGELKPDERMAAYIQKILGPVLQDADVKRYIADQLKSFSEETKTDTDDLLEFYVLGVTVGLNFGIVYGKAQEAEERELGLSSE